MGIATGATAILAGALLLLSTPARAQDAAPADTPPPPPAQQGGAAAPTPAQAPAPTDAAPQDGATAPKEGAAAPKPAPPGSSTELPPVQIIQEKAKPAPKAVQKKAPPKKKQVAAPAPPAPSPPPEQPAETVEPGMGGIDDGTVLMSPVEGSAIPIGKFPGGVGRADSSDIERTGDTYIPEVLQQTVPGVILEDAQGNVFQRNLQFRGFDSSPVNGVPQGLAVYQNGVRINESFGDIVNWDFLPDNAIDGMTIIGANPVFGLNAIGGAVTIFMRDGFNYEGAELDVRGGSFGRYQGALAVGGNSGSWGGFMALEGIHDDGYRDFSAARVRRMYTDIGAKGDGSEFHLNFTGAANYVGVTAAAPIQLLDLSWSRTFTSPQTTRNQMTMVSTNGSIAVTPTLTLSGVSYWRWFRQSHVDGNISEAEECATIADVLCLEGDDNEQLFGIGPGVNADGSIPDDIASPLGSLDKTSQNTNSWGTAAQGVDKSKLFGLGNQFLLGASYDYGNVGYGAGSSLGVFGPLFVVNDLGVLLTEPDEVSPRNLTTENTYVGVYFSDTLNLTSDFALTVGGRYNFARVKIADNTGEAPQLNGDSTFERFNPMVGATYEIMRGLTLYGSYAEANRAPTPAELACSDPNFPCLIESFLTADPPLDQVVSHTYELGLRGKLGSHDDQKLEWTAGLFHALSVDDIIVVADEISGRGFFDNAGDTLRQGVELGMRYTDKRLMVYANYALVEATFQTPFILASPNNPSAAAFNCAAGPPGPPLDPDEPLCVQVNDGDRIPGIPMHRFKAGFDYWLTSKWKFGADFLAASDQIFFGDEGNDNPPLAGYGKVDLHSSYDVTQNVQLYGIINNLFDARYGLFGNFYDLEAANSAAAADPSTGAGFFTNPRTITPSVPFTAYGGLKVRF